MRLLRIKEQIEICEQYTDRFSTIELSMMHDVSTFQIDAILTKYKVIRRTEPL